MSEGKTTEHGQAAGECECQHEGLWHYSKFEEKPLGRDSGSFTDFADVSLLKCKACGRLWLHVLVEQEHLTAAGRWARAIISEDDAKTMSPDRARQHLDAAPWYIFGGSYFGHAGKRGTKGVSWL